jgi:nitroreductase
MEVFEAIMARHSIRDFKSTPVPKATLVKILEAAVHAPSTINSQPWNIYVAGGEVIERIRKTYVEKMNKNATGKPEMQPTPAGKLPQVMQDRMAKMRKDRFILMGLDPEAPASTQVTVVNTARLFNAPVLLVLTMDRVLDKWSVYDMGLFSQNLLLAAQNEGLGSLIAVGLVTNPDILRSELGIPESQIIVIGIALGYVDTASPINAYVSPRLPLVESATFKGF